MRAILKIKTFFSTPIKLFYLIPLFIGCTGINGLNLIGGGVNTNPTKDYSGLKVIWIGGGAYHSQVIPGQLASGDVGHTVRAEGCNQSILWLFSWGDSSIASIKEKHKISKIGFIEYEQFAILGFGYHSFCTILYGEAEMKNQPVRTDATPVVPSEEKKEAGK